MARARHAERHCLVTMVFCLSLVALLPRGTRAQTDSETHIRIDSLLARPEVEAVLGSLSDDFLEHFILLVPELPEEDRGILAVTAEKAFATDELRASVARDLATDSSGVDVDLILEMYRSGPLAELREATRDYAPSISFAEFSGDIGSLDPQRLQLMVALVEARRSSDLALTIDEALRHVAHRLLATLGGSAGGFVPLTDEQLETAYRNRTIRLAVESMYRMEPASDDLVAAAVQAHQTDEASRFSRRYIEAMVAAIGEAGDDLIARLETDRPTAEAEPPEALDPTASPPCRVQVCGFLVIWNGPEPMGNSLAYGAPGDLEEFTFQYLVGGGYRLSRGPMDEGLTIQLRARSQAARCEVVVGTNPRSCLAVGSVRIDLIGSYPGFDGREPFTVRNRCRATDVLTARGISSLVAARIHYELTTYPGDERREPRC